MNVLSLFDGISCARVALERAGIPVEAYYASEVDKYAIQIAQKNYPDTIQVGSVVGLDCAQFKNIGLLIGGSPCQDLSIAKKDRKGLGGDRSGLFWEYVRILKEVEPKYFILENVASMPKEAKAIITEALGVEPIMIDAALVSAQRRKRLFWTNTPNVGQPQDRGVLLKDILEDGVETEPLKREIKGRIAGWNENDDTILAFNGDRKRSTIAEKVYHKPSSKTNAITIANVPKLVMKDKSNTIRAGGRSSGLGDKHEWDSVYQYRRNYWRETKGGKVPILTANMGTGGNNVPYVARATVQKNAEQYLDKCPTLTQAMGVGGGNVPLIMSEDKAERHKGKYIDGKERYNGIRKLTPLECERLQSLSDNYTEGVSNTQRYKALGNAFNVEVVAHILKHLL